MKRFGVTLTTALVSVLLFAGQALAQYPPTKTPGSPTGPGNGNGGGGGGGVGDPGGLGGGLAQTGVNVSAGLIILIALVVVGALLLFAGRRRRAGVTK